MKIEFVQDSPKRQSGGPIESEPCAVINGNQALECSTLQSMALNSFLKQLMALCQQRSYKENKRALKHYLKFQLPCRLRQQLLDLATRRSRIYTKVDLDIVELLLSPTVKEMRIESVRPFFRQPFVEMLRQLGTGLETLILQDNCWVQTRQTLPNALSRMTFLRYVSLRHLANDDMLASLGRSCPRLQEVDVSGSFDVTDAGLQSLCQPPDTIPTLAATAVAIKKKRKISAPARISNDPAKTILRNAGCIFWLPARLVQGIRHRRRSLISYDEDASYMDQDNEHYDDFHENEHECILGPCHSTTHDQLDEHTSSSGSLHKITAYGTQITPTGIEIALRYIPQLNVIR